MKDLSFFLFKNYIAAKMRKGIRNFCSGDDSTSTLNQHHKGGASIAAAAAAACRYGKDDQPCRVNPSVVIPTNSDDDIAVAKTSPTLEEMILQLEIEEEMARRKAHNDYVNIGMIRPGRLSCVNNSDILRSARNALNQYPRFSLDGKDAMYRSSFRNLDFVAEEATSTTRKRNKSVFCSQHRRFKEERSASRNGNDFVGDLYDDLPPNVAGERVVWCKPGVIAKLMGLEVMPVPVCCSSRSGSKEALRLRTMLKRQNLRRRAERHEMERIRRDMNTGSCGHCDGLIKRGRLEASGSRSGTAEHCVMKPVSVKASNDGGGWPTRRFGLVS